MNCFSSKQAKHSSSSGWLGVGRHLPPNGGHRPLFREHHREIDANGASLASQYKEKGSDSNKDGPIDELQNTPVENLISVGVDADVGFSKVSPEISKFVSVKCFKLANIFEKYRATDKATQTVEAMTSDMNLDKRNEAIVIENIHSSMSVNYPKYLVVELKRLEFSKTTFWLYPTSFRSDYVSAWLDLVPAWSDHFPSWSDNVPAWSNHVPARSNHASADPTMFQLSSTIFLLGPTSFGLGSTSI
ncbi:hypothetical protein FNV43_RR04641 [Rhamnella rubrinervis]|uniref:Uncharacterized protein n=1 Tax=Rhamnella rubrinervis TaxID=2594499 RepID=A0A8K0HL45_9ROSA|nr:hypothetical protein FNV43_RR04641 [Rhamnella rubrinervis]